MPVEVKNIFGPSRTPVPTFDAINSGMSKVNLPKNKLARFNNPKFPEQYIQQFEKVLAQKEELCQLLKTL